MLTGRLLLLMKTEADELLMKKKADECLFSTRRCQHPSTGSQSWAAQTRPASASGAGKEAKDLSLCMRRRMLSRLPTQTMYCVHVTLTRARVGCAIGHGCP